MKSCATPGAVTGSTRNMSAMAVTWQGMIMRSSPACITITGTGACCRPCSVLSTPLLYCTTHAGTCQLLLGIFEQQIPFAGSTALQAWHHSESNSTGMLPMLTIHSSRKGTGHALPPDCPHNPWFRDCNEQVTGIHQAIWAYLYQFAASDRQQCAAGSHPGMEIGKLLLWQIWREEELAHQAAAVLGHGHHPPEVACIRVPPIYRFSAIYSITSISKRRPRSRGYADSPDDLKPLLNAAQLLEPVQRGA